MNDDYYDELEANTVYRSEPFNEPDDRRFIANTLHPRFDSEIDNHEMYDVGMGGAAGMGDFANDESYAAHGEETRRYRAEYQL